MHDTAPSATFYHDGCATCLGIAAALGRLMPGLEIVDLGRQGDRIAQAGMLGIDALPCLVIDGEVLPVAQHSALSDLAAGAH